MINLTAIAEKEKLIDSYIERCDHVHSYSESKDLESEIIAVFCDEIPNIDAGLDHGPLVIDKKRPLPVFATANSKNIKLLCAKLKNYRANIKQRGVYATTGCAESSEKGQAPIYISQTTSNSPMFNNNVSISLEQTIEYINQLPCSILSPEEKELLSGKLAQISFEKEPESRWEKAKGALKWIAEKGIEVGIAALPYIVEALKK